MNVHDSNLEERQQRFLETFAETGNVSAAARSVPMVRQMHYQWLDLYPDYAKAFEDAKGVFGDRLEAEAVRRATEGVKRFRFNRNGEPLIDPETGGPYHEKVFSDVLLIFLLKAKRPEEFGDKVEQTHKGDRDSPVTLFELPRNGREAEG